MIALRASTARGARKIATATTESGATLHRLQTMMERAERIRTQRPKDKGIALRDACFGDADNPGVEIIHRGRFKSMTNLQRRWFKRR